MSPSIRLDLQIYVRVSSDIAPGDTRELIETKIRDYLKTMVFSGSSLSYAQIGKLIFEVPGIRDYSDLEINGQAGNITLPGKAVFVLGGVEVEQL